MARASLVALALAHYALAAAPAAPNIVLLLMDDVSVGLLDQSLALMPNLRERVAAKGATLTNAAAATPLCGPSRASLLSGRFAHNNGYTADDDWPSMGRWLAIQNNTLGAWLTAAGYYTAYQGKSINGLEVFVPSGWRHWGGFMGALGTYNYRNSTPYNVSFAADGVTQTSPTSWRAMEGVHQADYLGQDAVGHMRAALAESRPFFLHLAPTMAHFGTCDGPHLDLSLYADADPFWELALAARHGCPNASANQGCKLPISPCPSARNAGAAAGREYPHAAAWNVSASGVLPLEMARPPLTSFEAGRQSMGYRNRTASLVDLDDMLGVVLDGLDALGLENSSFVLVTSDNGYHLGEHRLPMGKEHPYDTDVRVPLVVRGPGIPAGVALPAPVTLVDLTATVLELAGGVAHTGPALDGQSFAQALTGAGAAASLWQRNFTFSEPFDGRNSWVHVRFPGDAPGALARASFTRWCTNESEVYDLQGDAQQLRNIAGEAGRGREAEAQGRALALALLACSGETCASPVAGQGAAAVPCYKITH
jgi:N-acetylglucosamine-6-sulfatase